MGHPPCSVRQAERSTLAEGLWAAVDSTWRLVAPLPDLRARALPEPPASPPLWECGHLTWFMERWCLRDEGSGASLAASRLSGADQWFDPQRQPHSERWTLPLPPAAALHDWTLDVLDATLARLSRVSKSDTDLFPFRLTLLHMLQRGESIGCALNLLGLPQPDSGWDPPPLMTLCRDARVGRAESVIGVVPGDGFALDVEYNTHPSTLEPYEISLEPVTATEFLQFVLDDGYRRPELWDPAAFARLSASGRTAPARWRRHGDRWQMRWFDRWLPLEGYAAAVQVDAFEAQAWCAWARRRLPTEDEWEHAARRIAGFEWGDAVWEWTASIPAPYPGYRPHRLRQRTPPWGDPAYRVVRGGSAVTPRAALEPHRRRFVEATRHDLLTGFRSCIST